MKYLIFVLVLFGVAAIGGTNEQKKLKPWEEWSRKDAEAILNDSPWGQTQVETDLSEMFFQPQADPNVTPRAANANRDQQGATNQATAVKYRIRFLSAKPVREAFARIIILDHPDSRAQLSANLNDFVNRKFDEWIAVAVTFESRDQRFLNAAAQSFDSAIAATLKNKTYLQRADGKRIFLEIYQAPSPDGLGAKFIFRRLVDERPFLNLESKEVRFVSEVSKNITLNMRFKVADMVYGEQLEY